MATSEQQSSKAEKDEDEKLWAEVYEKIEDASCKSPRALDHSKFKS